MLATKVYARVDFRIFIDAATLKHKANKLLIIGDVKFPHLYRCGHIEAVANRTGDGGEASYFRIFIDAATLKHPRRQEAAHIRATEFPHLYRCGHIEASNL